MQEERRQEKTVLVERDRVRIGPYVTVADLKQRRDVDEDVSASYWDGDGFVELGERGSVAEVVPDGAPIVFGSTDHELVAFWKAHGRQAPDTGRQPL